MNVSLRSLRLGLPATLLLGGLLGACAGSGATPVPLATRLPTHTPPPGEAPPSTLPGDPGAAQSRTDDATSAEGVIAVSGEWPDLLFASLFERPIDTDGSYRADLDLVAAELSVEGEWVYVGLRLAGPQVPGSGAHYAVEFDTDLDGHPDVLVLAWPTRDTAWSSTRMRAYLDTDRNVGGNRPRLAELPVAEWDGFETQREDAGTLIWERAWLEDGSGLQLAVARWMLAEPAAFAWRAWAEGAGFNPGRQEYNDFHSLEAAGSPYAASAFYPARSLVAIDNTCVVSHGHLLSAALPGYCGTTVVGMDPSGKPPDDQVYAAGGRGAIIRLASPPAGTSPEAASLVIPAGILATPTP